MIYSGRARKLIMSDGSEYFGLGFGADSDSRVCEIVFNTSPVGYQEILSDPSYTDQFVVMAYPLIGNYGINDDDYETRRPTIGGFIVRDYNDCPSNFRSKASLSQVMKKLGIPGITGLDTREIVRKIRSQGTQKALITDAELPLEEGLRLLGETVLPTDAVSRVSRNYRENYIAMVWMQCDSLPMECHGGRGDAGQTRRHISFKWPRRPDRCPRGDNACEGAARQISDFRDLPRPSDHLACLRRRDLQIEIRSSRRQSSCQGSCVRKNTDHFPESFLCGG